jgi:hypothetical protein
MDGTDWDRLATVHFDLGDEPVWGGSVEADAIDRRLHLFLPKADESPGSRLTDRDRSNPRVRYAPVRERPSVVLLQADRAEAARSNHTQARRLRITGVISRP